MTQERSIIVGADGMLGRCWRLHHAGMETPCRFVDVAGCDIRDQSSIHGAITPDTRIVINCAAYTNVDSAETDETSAFAINATGVANLARRCQEIGALLVHYSTDYVFDGRASAPYRTDYPRNPVGAYGRTKAAGEEAIEKSGCESLIIRTSWLYAPHANNFVRTIARLANERESLRVVNDQIGRPTSADQLVATTAALIAAGARGIFHATDSGQCSWHEFATFIAARVNPGCRVDPCTTAEFPRPAPRPAYSVLDISATERLAGPIPSWQSSLSRVLDTILVDAVTGSGSPSR